MSSTKSSASGSTFRVLSAITVAVLSIPVAKTIQAGDPLIYMIPNFLLMTPFHRAAPAIWKYLDPPSRLPKDRHEQKIRSMDAADYNIEAFKEFTDNFRYPALVKGLMLNTTGVAKWGTKGYLSEKIGDYDVKVSWRVNETEQFDTNMSTFRESFDEMSETEHYYGRLFFPVFKQTKSSSMKSAEKSGLNKLVADDLETDLIWEGFGKHETHSSFLEHQFSIGTAKPPEKNHMPTFDWHCEAGSNWYVQVSGSKEWFLIDPKNSAYLMPHHKGQGARVVRASDHKYMLEMHDRLPYETVKLEPGDVLFVPEWVWHSTFRDEGLSIAVAMREFNLTNSLRLNTQYMGVIANFNAYAVVDFIVHFIKSFGV